MNATWDLYSPFVWLRLSVLVHRETSFRVLGGARSDLKKDTGRMVVADKAGFQRKVRSSMRQLQNHPGEIISFFQKLSLKYAA
jgi:hypothetical protein